jgi:hypothetical protein
VLLLIQSPQTATLHAHRLLWQRNVFALPPPPRHGALLLHLLIPRSPPLQLPEPSPHPPAMPLGHTPCLHPALAPSFTAPALPRLQLLPQSRPRWQNLWRRAPIQYSAFRRKSWRVGEAATWGSRRQGYAGGHAAPNWRACLLRCCSSLAGAKAGSLRQNAVNWSATCASAAGWANLTDGQCPN